MSRTRTKSRTELPEAVYAAAGAGDLAYQQLRKLPEVTARTLRNAGQSADALRQRLATGDRDLSTELTQVRTQFRESARRGAEALAARAAVAQEKAVTRYRSLVARGEQVVSERFGATTGHAGTPTKVEVVVGDREPVTPAVSARPTTPAATTGRTTGTGRSATTGRTTGTGRTASTERGTAGQNARGVARNGAKTAGRGPAA